MASAALWGTVIVTGGGGFIGSNLVRMVCSLDLADRIVCLDNNSSGGAHNHVLDTRVTYVYGNSWDINELLQAETPTIVFHFGEFSRIVPSFERVNYVWLSNSLGTQRVLEYCVAKKAKLIYSGSSSIFGNAGNDSDLSPYAFLKKQNIQLIKNYGAWFGLDYAITYFYNVFGPGDIGSGDYSTCIAKFRRQYAAGKPLTVVSPGNQRRIWTHVADIVAGVIMVAQRGFGDGYKLASDDDVSILELVHLFGRKATHIIVPERRGERFQSVCGEASRARTELAWAPKIRLECYLRDFVDSKAHAA
jgi:UDP-glucose 4-epimerase